MPRAILAIRHYPHALLLAGLLFLCSLILAAGSIGSITGGGGGDDEGSGLGGTGRVGEFGGSGFGGTGSPNPFVGQGGPVDNDDGSAGEEPGEAPQEESFREIAPPESLELAPAEPVPGARRSIRMAIGEPADTAADAQRQPDWPTADTAALAEQLERAAREDLMRYGPGDARDSTGPASDSRIPLFEIAVDDESDEGGDSEEEAGDTDRRSSPERLQRPELPPFQRGNPVRPAGGINRPTRPMHI